ncbi:MAG: carboxypeptidase-like regulatory domain-containing protein [Planctomycetota bacterium]
MPDRHWIFGLGSGLILTAIVAVALLMSADSDDSWNQLAADNATASSSSSSASAENQDGAERDYLEAQPQVVRRRAFGPSEDRESGETHPASALPVSIQVVILDSSITAVPGLELTLTAVRSGVGFEGLGGFTDKKGCLKFLNLPPRVEFRLQAHSDRWYLTQGRTISSGLAGDSSEYRREAYQFGAVSGRVIDAEGAPQAKVLVGLKDGEVVATDSQGLFSMRHVRAYKKRRRLVAADAELMLTGTAAIESLSESGAIEGIEITVHPSPVIEGRVQDERQEEVAGAKVRVHSFNGFRRSDWSLLWKELDSMPRWELKNRSIGVVTDEEGRYRLPLPFPGRAKMTVKVENAFTRGGTRRIRAVRGDFPRREDFVVDRGGVLRGAIVWPQGMPSEGTLKIGAYRLSGRFRKEIEIPVGDTFELPGLLDGSYALVLTHSAERALHGQLNEVRAALSEVTGPYRVEMLPAVRVRGALKDRAGTPIPRARVSLRQTDSRQKRRTAKTLTDVNGEYQIDGWTQGQYRISVSVKGFQRTPLRVRAINAGETVEENFELARALDLRGRCFEVSGRPAVEAEVILKGPRSSTVLKTDVEGSFLASDLQPGWYFLSVSRLTDEGQWLAGAAMVNMVAGDDNVFVELLPAIELLGIVKSKRGRAVSKVSVIVSERRYGRVVKKVKVDRKGRFRIRGLPAGQYRVTTKSRNRRIRGKTNVTLHSGVKPAKLRLRH